MTEENKSRLTRNRPSLVCINCKKRKIKCNRGHPCSSCTHYKCEDLCIYEDILTDRKNKIVKTKLKEPKVNRKSNLEIPPSHPILSSNHDSAQNFTTPVNDSDEIINFYEDYTSILVKDNSRGFNSGPFAWSSLIAKDKYLLSLKQYTLLQRIKEKESHSTSKITSLRKVPSAHSEKLFQSKFLERNECVDTRPYEQIIDESIDDSEIKKTAFSSPYFGISLFDDRLNQELLLIDRIRHVLPKQKVIWLHINRFFKVLYPFMPFLDETSFLQELGRIIGPQEHNDKTIEVLNIEKRLDLAYIGILLTILRLSYSSLFSTRNPLNEIPSTERDEDKNYLLSNPINQKLVEVSKSCLFQFQLLKKPHFQVLQCALYIRLYQVFAPEEGDGADGGDSQTFNGMLIQMAYSLGLNREPDKFKSGFCDEKDNNLSRKIWYFLVFLDIMQAYTYGNPLCCNSMYYDTKLPYYKDGNANTSDNEVEKSVIKAYKFIDDLVKGPILSILDLCLDVHAKIKLCDLKDHLERLESKNIAFGNLRSYLTTHDSDSGNNIYSKTIRFIITLSLVCFSLSLNYHIFLFYEKKKNSPLQFQYLRKFILLTMQEVIPYILPFIINTRKYFGEGAETLIIPKLLMTIHRTIEVTIAVIIRVNTDIYKMNHEKDSQYSSRFSKIMKFSKYLRMYAELCLASLSQISDRFYYAWGVIKSQGFLLKIVTDRQFYKENFDPSDELPDFTGDQIQELINICEPPLKVFETMIMENCKDNTMRNVFSNSEYHFGSTNENASNNIPSQPAYQLQHNGTNPLDASYNICLDELENLNSINSSEIDNFWLLMLYTKNNHPFQDTTKTFTQKSVETSNANNTIESASSDNSLNRSHNPIYSIDFENSNLYDYFSDLPLDKLFDQKFFDS